MVEERARTEEPGAAPAAVEDHEPVPGLEPESAEPVEDAVLPERAPKLCLKYVGWRIIRNS